MNNDPVIPAARPGLDPQARERAQLRKASVEFETLVVREFLKAARGDGARGMFGGGFAEDMFLDELDGERARFISQSGGIGLARDLERQVLGGKEVVLKKYEPLAERLNQRVGAKLAHGAYK